MERQKFLCHQQLIKCIGLNSWNLMRSIFVEPKVIVGKKKIRSPVSFIYIQFLNKLSKKNQADQVLKLSQENYWCIWWAIANVEISRNVIIFERAPSKSNQNIPCAPIVILLSGLKPKKHIFVPLIRKSYSNFFFIQTGYKSKIKENLWISTKLKRFKSD